MVWFYVVAQRLEGIIGTLSYIGSQILDAR